MDALSEQIGRVTLGPAPVPYIFGIALIPFWMSFSSHENSLLISMCVLVTVIVKGSLLSCRMLNRVTSWIVQVMLVSCVMVAQIILLHISLHASLFSLIFLVPPSTFTGICIYKLHNSRRIIGIFSRSAPEDYMWLASRLNRVRRVDSFSITNSNSQQFRQKVSECVFAILYHSKTRGRVNIANVTDSLYDDELKHMSHVLGKSNMIVVADDMDDSSPSKEKSILANQPLIAQLTRGLYLFSTEDKKHDQLMKDKVQPICDIISRGSMIDMICDLVLVFLVIAPWFYFIYSIFHVIFLITTNLSGSILISYANNTRNDGACVVGIAAVLLLMVVELSALYWGVSNINMVFIIAQSLGTAVFIVTMSRI